jgi:hypothetical protein
VVLTAIFYAVILAALACSGCIGPGLEPPTEQPIGAMGEGPGTVGVPNAPAAGANGQAGQAAGGSPPDMGAGGSFGAPVPTGGSTAGTAGMAAPSGGGGGTGTAGNAGAAGAAGEPSSEPTADAGATDCEVERLPALGLGQRIIAPWRDGGLLGNACEYELPESAPQYLPDHVNLQHTLDGQSTSVPRVSDVTACDPIQGGFYYDNPQDPAMIIACAASCTRFGQGGDVEIVLGCPTVTQP